jgi:hypothetical protein
MSARLGFNERPYIPWKGKTFVQITSILKKNLWVNKKEDQNLFFRARPIKHYRREIASMYDNSYCSSRASRSINELDRPNGSIVVQSPSAKISYKGLVGTVDINLTNNKTEHPGSLGCNNPYVCTETNARNRVRSSGMIKRKFNVAKNNDTYYTNAGQYLTSRNKTFQQNQYNFLRSGDSTSKPGDAVSSNNQYHPQGLTHCQKYYLPTDSSFQYQWLDGGFNRVDVSAGYYDTDDLNTRLTQTLLKNHHYFINNALRTNIYLLSIGYDIQTQRVKLQSTLSNSTRFSTATGDSYSVPTDMSSQPWANSGTKYGTVAAVPVFCISNNVLGYAMGFSEGYYPSIKVGNGQTMADQLFYSSFTPRIKPTSLPVYYKPSNSQFATQGGVSASSLITRVKYNTITNNTVGYSKAYGSAVANSLAYGVPDYGYTLKDRIGYPLTKTPVFNKVTGNLIDCRSADCTVAKY